MTREEIIEGNRLIALSPFIEEDLKSWLEDIGTPSDKFCLDILRYHSSCDWLMPVYCKINKTIQLRSQLDFKFATDTDELHFNIWNALEDEDACIEFLYQELVKFIKWYNKQKV